MKLELLYRWNCIMTSLLQMCNAGECLLALEFMEKKSFTPLPHPLSVGHWLLVFFHPSNIFLLLLCSTREKKLLKPELCGEEEDTGKMRW